MVHLYSADRSEPLARRLAEVLTDDPGDPISPEWLAVPSDGMRRWVTLELARYLGASDPATGDGVAANFVRAYPGTLRQALLDAGTGAGTDPWTVDRMVWPLLSLFDEYAGTDRLPSFTELPDGGSRFTRVRAVADLFDRYHLHRPEMVRAWARGEWLDGNLQGLPEHSRWQGELWSCLRGSIGSDSPPERMADLLGAVRDDPRLVDLPSRLLFFGFTTLPGHGFLDLVDAVGAHRDVHLFLLEPHRFEVEALRCERSTVPPHDRRLRAADPTGALAVQPLLRTWGRLPRETAVLLGEAQAGPTTVVAGPPQLGGPAPDTLLGRLQADIRSNRVSEPAPVDDDDRSVQFHSCFGPMRQVQVARDALLHLLNDGASGLTEEDVLVVCPGLERFAPLIEAVFGSAAPVAPEPTGPSREQRLRYRIADRSIRTANPVLGATSALLALVSGRFELTELLDFVSLGPVRERFGFDESALATIADWATDTNVRWGLDPGHRAGFGIPDAVVANTWQAALDRLLLGAATSDADGRLAIGGIAPFGVDSGDAEVLGSFADIMARLASLAEWRTAGRTDGRPTLDEWVRTLRSACSDLMRAPSQAQWQFDALQVVFNSLLEDAGWASGDPACGLDLLDVRRLIEGHLDAEPGRPDFFRGGITVTSMTPLRWVPFRVVCVLGLDQDFVTSSAPDAADLMAAAPQLGDPDTRSESRQALLETVLAATDHLVVVRDGRDVRSNHVVPRVVPAAELFDALLALAPPGDDRSALARRLETAHPRHPFDERCLIRGGLVDGVTWSFDRSDLLGAEHRRTRPERREPFLDHGLDVADLEVVPLSDLRSFLLDPIGWFLQRTLDVTLPRPAEEADTVLPVSPSGLELQGLGQDLLEARARGVDDDTWRIVERARGALPPGVLEDRTVDDLLAEIDSLEQLAGTRGLAPGAPVDQEVDIELRDGTRIVGSIPLRLDGPERGPGAIRFTRPKATDRLGAWLDLMALVADDPSGDWRSLVVTRAKDKRTKPKPIDLVVTLPSTGDAEPVEARRAAALGALEVAVDLFRRGSAEPLPLFAGYSPAQHADTSGDGSWKSHDGRGDATKPAVRLVFGDIEVDELEDIPCRPDDPDGAAGTGRAERYARHLWGTVASTCEDAS